MTTPNVRNRLEFDTALGRCAIGWRAAAVVGVRLPEDGVSAEAVSTDGRGPDGPTAHAVPPDDGPPVFVRRAIAGIVALLDGELIDLAGTPLDLAGVPSFHRDVYEVALTIGPGETLSYGDIARRLGQPGSARAVGQALGRNPIPIIVPCHRVLAAGGRIGGFSAGGGAGTKHRLLDIERVHSPDAPPTLFDL